MPIFWVADGSCDKMIELNALENRIVVLDFIVYWRLNFWYLDVPPFSVDDLALQMGYIHLTFMFFVSFSDLVNFSRYG